MSRSHGAIVDARQARFDQLSIGHDVVLIVIETPDVAERAEGDVELAARSSRWRRCAIANTSSVSWLTCTGAMPAFLFSRTTSLPSLQTLSSDSSRSNSRNTCSKLPRLRLVPPTASARDRHPRCRPTAVERRVAQRRDHRQRLRLKMRSNRRAAAPSAARLVITRNHPQYSDRPAISDDGRWTCPEVRKDLHARSRGGRTR